MNRIIVVIGLSIILLIIGPIATIWSMNTLFPVLDIPYTFETWLATILLGLFIRAKVEK